MSVEACDRRERDIGMSTKGKASRWLNLIAPGPVDHMALATHNKH